MNRQTLRKSILNAIRDLDGGGYGVSIADVIEQETGERVSTGVLYVALGDLEDENLIVSKSERGGVERGYRDKKVFSLTGHGLAEIRENGAKDSL